MTDNQSHSPTPFDLGKLLDSAIVNPDVQMTHEAHPVYSWSFPSAPVDLEFTLEFEFKSKFFQRPQTIEWTQRGRYWFDRSFKAEGVISSLQLKPETGETNIEFTGSVFTDTTDYGILARFLRWILRR